MSLFAKIMVVVNLILAVVFLSAAGTFLGAQENWKTQHSTLKTSLEDTIAKKDDQIKAADARADALALNLAEMEKAKVAAETQLASDQASMRNLNEANGQLREAIERLSNTYQTVQDANTRLEGEKANLNEKLNAAQSDARDARSETDTANGTIAQQAQQIADLEKQVASLEMQATANAETIDAQKTTLALYQATYGDLPAGLTPIDVAGRIQAVDNEMDIFVISVGERDKVAVGHEFTVYRGNDYVSTIVVDQVFPNSASCHTKKGMKKSDVKAGDEVATRL